MSLTQDAKKGEHSRASKKDRKRMIEKAKERLEKSRREGKR